MFDVTPGEPFSELEMREKKHFTESTRRVANVLNRYFLVTGSCDIVVVADRQITLYQLPMVRGVVWE
jgi:hypothetical protein